MDTLPFYIFLFIHLVSLIVGFGSVLVVDFFGFLLILKRVRLSLVGRVADVTQKLIWTGWIGLVLSGIGLITIKGYIDNLTEIKLFFVILIGINGIFLHLIKKSFKHIHDSEHLPMLLKFRIGLATLISQVGWWGAILIGFVHRHWQHNIDWPPHPRLYIFAIAVIILVLYFLGETILRTRRKIG